jgi:hypothetical protein
MKMGINEGETSMAAGYAYGVVKDTGGTGISGATVEFVGLQTDTCNQDGQYMDLISADTYTLKASASGYVTETRTDVTYVAAHGNQQDFTLTAV